MNFGKGLNRQRTDQHPQARINHATRHDHFQAIRSGDKLRAKFMRNAPFQFKPADWFGFFGALGWRPAEVRFVWEEGERLKRPIPLPLRVKLLLALAGLFGSRGRQAGMKRFAAYMCLVPD